MNTAATALTVEHEQTSVQTTDQSGTESAAIFQIISRLASNPAADPDKIERFLAMREKELNRMAEQAFNSAMKEAQAEMRSIGADANNSQTKSKYATYAKLDSVLRPIYTKHGFSVSFDEADSPKPDHIRVLAYVAHEAGFTRTYRKDMPADGKGAKGGDVMTKTHATGAAASYGMRYLLKGIFNVAVGEEDTDGNAPPENTQSITTDQAQIIHDLIDETETEIDKFCELVGVNAVCEIAQSHFARVVGSLAAKKRRMGK